MSRKRPRPGMLLKARCLAAALPVAVAVTIVPFLPGGAAAAETEVGAGISLAFGYDSNPLRVSGDGRDGGFADVRFDAGLDVALGRRTDLFVTANGFERLYGSGAGEADSGGADLRVGLELSRVRIGQGRLSVAFGGLYGSRRSTFTDRLTGEIYEVDTDPPTMPATTVPIPDRFDTDTTGAFLDTRWRVGRRLRLSLDATLENTDYTTDYTDATALESLDYRSLTLEPGVAVQVSEAVVVEASVILTDLDFDEQSALDRAGDPVAGVTREYGYTDYRVRVRLYPARQWRVNVGVTRGDRRDASAGYYDFDAWTGYVSMDRRFGSKARFQAYASVRRLDYANAAVPGDPEGDLRGNDVRRFIGRFDRELHDHFGVFVEGGAQRTDSQDPVFAYDRDWVLTGVRIRR